MGLEIKIEKVEKTDFEAIGLAGEYDLIEKKIEPIKLFIGTTEEVRKWLNKFGGLDIIEYVRYDTYYKVLKKVKELEKNEEIEYGIKVIREAKDEDDVKIGMGWIVLGVLKEKAPELISKLPKWVQFLGAE